MTDDATLIDRALQGESAAFGQLVTKYQDRLFNSLVHLTGSREDAQDVAQDAFVRAYVKLETFARESGFYTWLYRVAFNVAVSRRRREKPQRSLDQGNAARATDPIDHGPAPHARLEQAERVDQVQRALASLGDESRGVMILREVEGCSYEEISAILELPIGTVRSRLHRARMQLKDALKDVVQEETK